MSLFRKLKGSFKLFSGFVFIILLLTSCDNGGGTPDIFVGSATVERHAIGGVITAVASSGIDSDVNDARAPYSPNDDFSTAQRVNNPLNLSGYVNVVEQGEKGRSYLSGDSSDCFIVDLIARQTITLILSDWPTHKTSDNVVINNDLSLAVYDSDKKLVADSLSGSAVEQVVIADAGRYYIHVHAVTGATNYTLNIGAMTTASHSGFSTFSDFVEGEAIVALNEQSDVVTARRMVKKYGLEVSRGANLDLQLWRLPNDSSARLASLKSMGIRLKNRDIIGLTPSQQRKRETLYMIKALSADPSIAYAEPNHIYKTTAAANDQYYNHQWSFPLINLDSAWDQTQGVNPVVVAVIDGGILPSHPDLLGKQLSTGYDFMRDPEASGDGDGLDADPSDVNDGGAYYVFHGTHVAGIIAAKSNNTQGVAGVAGEWPIKLMPLRVIGTQGDGSTYDVVQAIYYAAGLPNNSGIQLSGRDVANVINMSFGGLSRNVALDAAIAAAINKNIIVVAAAGNNSSSLPFYPASTSGVVSVSAVGADKKLASYSNYGISVDVAAPGGDLEDDFNGDGSPDGLLSTAGRVTGIGVVNGSVEHNYAYLQGTSMASPHVAGVAALMKAIYPAMTPQIFDAWLQSGVLTEDIGSRGRDDSFGYGLIDAYKSVVVAQNAVSGAPQPLLYSNPDVISFGLIGESVVFDVSNLGAGAAMIVSPVSSEAWLSVECQRDLQNSCTTDAQGLGRYVATINRQLLPLDANYAAAITFTSDIEGGFYTIPVVAQRLTPILASDAGHLYVVLIDAASGERAVGVESFQVSAVDGQYRYKFKDVRLGSYQIMAGSDSDNDYRICDGGESCGAFSFYSDTSVVEVNSSLTGLNFNVSIGLILSTLSAKANQTGIVLKNIPSQANYK